MIALPALSTLLRDTFRLLTFQKPSAALHTHWQGFLLFGLMSTWLAGIGRYWDHPRAELWQLLGLGSLAYVLVLAALLWLLLWPLRPRNCSYRNLLMFICLTSPPALLYAIPVERFMTMDAAAQTNAIFLGVVASWRVALLTVFLRRVAGLDWFSLVIATLLPLALIVLALTLLNLEHVVFNLMGGIRAEDRSVHDVSYTVVVALTYFAFLASPILLLGYVIAIIRRW